MALPLRSHSLFVVYPSMSELDRRCVLLQKPFSPAQMLNAVRKMLKLIPAAACLFLTGCMGYTLTPEKPAAMPRAAEAPLALKVGLVVENDGGFGPRFAEALESSRLFEEVRRGALSGVDLVLRGKFSGDFKQDPFQAPKIIFVVFTGLVTGAVMSETSHHLAQGALSVARPGGETLKSYDRSVDVVAKSMVSVFAEQKTMALGPPAAKDNLIANLVQALIDDRAFFAGLGVSQPEAAAAAPAPEEPMAAAEPEAAPAPEPSPPSRTALTPAEESEIDEQLMP